MGQKQTVGQELLPDPGPALTCNPMSTLTSCHYTLCLRARPFPFCGGPFVAVSWVPPPLRDGARHEAACLRSCGFPFPWPLPGRGPGRDLMKPSCWLVLCSARGFSRKCCPSHQRTAFPGDFSEENRVEFGGVMGSSSEGLWSPLSQKQGLYLTTTDT